MSLPTESISCPACEELLPADAGECPSCGLVLLQGLSTDIQPHLAVNADGLVTVAVARSSESAEILIGRLAAEGIKAIATGEVTSALQYLRISSPYPISIQVLARQAKRALQILAAEGTWSEEELNRYLSMLDEALPAD